MALDLEPSTAEVRLLLEAGYLAAERREYAKAREIFEGVIALGRGADVARVGLANIHLLQSQPKEAEKLLREAVKSSPANAYAWAQLGEFLHTQGKKDEALETLAKARSLDSSGAFGGMAQAVEEAVRTDLAYKYQVPGRKGAKGAGAKKK